MGSVSNQNSRKGFRPASKKRLKNTELDINLILLFNLIREINNFTIDTIQSIAALLQTVKICNLLGLDETSTTVL